MGAIVGREKEWAVVATFVEGLRRGPSALILEGEAGIGKTTLVRAAAAAASSGGSRVLTASPAPSEKRLSFTALADLLDGVVDESLKGIPSPQRLALEMALLRTGERGVAPDQRTVSVAVLGVLRRLAERGAVLVVVDDLQWLDGPTHRILEFAIRRLGDVPVSVLAAMRPSPTLRDPFMLSRSLQNRDLRRVHLGPMTVASLQKVIRHQLDLALPHRIALKVHEGSGGNPFYALELVRAVGSAVVHLAPGGDLPVPADLRLLVHGRLAALPAEVREAVLVASACSHPTAKLIVSVLGSGGADVLAAAQKAGVLRVSGDRVHVVHPLLGSTAYADTDAAERRSLHARLASVILDTEEHARHRARATEPPDAEVATVLDAGAMAAARRGAPEAAGELYEMALAFTPPEASSDVRRRTIAAAQHHAASGDRSRARELLEELVAICERGPRRAEALLVLAEVRYQDDSFPEATELLKQALEEAEDSLLRAQIALDLGFGLALVGDLAGAEPHVRTAVELADADGTPGLVAEALAVASVVEHLFGRDTGRKGIERAVALEDPTRQTPLPMRPRFVDAYLRMWTGQLEEASAVFQSTWRAAVEHGEEGVLPLFAFWGGAVQAECWRGSMDAAAAYADAAMEAAARDGGDVALALALGAQSCVHAYLGQCDAARSEGRAAISLFRRAGWDMASLFPSGVLAFVELSSGDPAAAVELFETSPSPWTAGGVREPTATPFVPDAVEALVYVGQKQLATTVLNEFEVRARSLDRPWAIAAGWRCRALLLAAEGLIDEAAKAIEEALIEHERASRMPVELGRTLLVQGQLLRRRKEKRAANAVLNQAMTTFQAVGAAAWAKRAQGELARVGLRPSAPQTLTAVEMEVAVLASRGLTVKEVAAQLFLSPKTAEGILGRVYRKLEVRSRVALAAKLRRDDVPDEAITKAATMT